MDSHKSKRRTLAVTSMIAAMGAYGSGRRDIEVIVEGPEPTAPEIAVRYEAADYGSKPARTVTHADRARLEAAQEKRARKAAKRLATHPREKDHEQ